MKKMIENREDQLSQKSIKAVRMSWVLLLILMCIELPLKIVAIEKQWIEFIELLFVYGMLFSWYFVCNKSWGSTLRIFVLIGISLLTQSPLLYLMFSKQTVGIESGWLFELISISVTITAIFLIAKMYLQEEKTKISKKKVAKAFLLIGIFFFTIPNNSLINESFSVFEINIIDAIFTVALKVVYSISLLVLVYYLFGIIRQGGSVFTIPEVDLSYFSQYFFKVFAILYAAIFTLFYTLLGELFLEKAVTVYHHFSIVTILHYASQIVVFIILILILGQVLRYKALQEKSYYGICGVLLFIPIINILFYLLIGLNKHHLILDSNKPYSKKHWHILIGLLLLWGAYWFGVPAGNSELFLLHTLIFVLFLLVSIINIGRMWQVALVFAIISASLSGVIDYLISSILVLLSSPSPSLFTFESLLSMSLLFVGYYAIIYSIRHTFLYQDD